jgi:hypothetical protein
MDKGQRAAWRLESMEPFDAATLLVSSIADVLALSQWLSTQSNSLIDCWVGSNAQWNVVEARKLMTDALNVLIFAPFLWYALCMSMVTDLRVFVISGISQQFECIVARVARTSGRTAGDGRFDFNQRASAQDHDHVSHDGQSDANRTAGLHDQHLLLV